MSGNPCVKRPQPSAHLRYQKFKTEVKRLSMRDVRELIQMQPFERLVRDKLCHKVERVGVDGVVLLADAAAAYVHEIYEDAFNVTAHSGKRKMQMARDLEATLHAKGPSIVFGNSGRRRHDGGEQ